MGPWYRVDRQTVVFDPVAGFGLPLRPVGTTELGTEAPEADDGVWTGETDGPTAGTCGGWTSNAGTDKGVYGYATQTVGWSNRGIFTMGCDHPFALYCFEQ